VISDDNTIDDLVDTCASIRRQVQDLEHQASGSHGSLSTVELLVTLFHHQPENQLENDRNRCILSRGYAETTLECILSSCCYTALDNAKRVGKQQANPDWRSRFLVEVSSQPCLTDGLAFGLGMALAFRLDRKPTLVYVLLGLEEVQEGHIWSTARLASHNHADNIVAIVDNNRVQLEGFVKDAMDYESIGNRLTAYGWRVLNTDGRSIPALRSAWHEANKKSGCPTCVIANTGPILTMEGEIP
jgi:transketolase